MLSNFPRPLYFAAVAVCDFVAVKSVQTKNITLSLAK